MIRTKKRSVNNETNNRQSKQFIAGSRKGDYKMKDFESNLREIQRDIRTYYNGLITPLEYAEARILSNKYFFFYSDNLEELEELNQQFLEFVKANTEL